MTDADVVARKLLRLNEALEELKRPQAREAAALVADPLLRAAVERWVQVAIECCVDIATHVIGAEGWTPPATSRAAFQVLAGHGRIPVDLARRLGAAAGLRNLLVHHYTAIDLTRLAAAVRDDLDDLREFAAVSATWIHG